MFGVVKRPVVAKAVQTDKTGGTSGVARNKQQIERTGGAFGAPIEVRPLVDYPTLNKEYSINLTIVFYLLRLTRLHG